MAITITKSTAGCVINDTGNKKAEYHLFPFGTIISVTQKHFSGNKTKMVVRYIPIAGTEIENYEFFYSNVTSPTTTTPDELAAIIIAYNIDNPWPVVYSANPAQTEFVMTATGGANIMVFVNGVLQGKDIDYTYDGVYTVTFTAAMAGGESVHILKIK